MNLIGNKWDEILEEEYHKDYFKKIVLYINNLDKFQAEEMGKRYFGSVIIQLVNYNGNIVIENR